MKFRVGPHHYRVKLHDPEQGPLADESGDAVVSLFSWRARTITIDGGLPLAQRFDALLSALSRAYDDHFGRPGTADGQANRNATFAIDVQKQLEQQGGLWALGQLQPDGTHEAQLEDDVPNTAYAVQCPCCSGKIASGDVSTSPPRLDLAVAHQVVDRSAACDFCGIRIEWVEAATTSGKPNGKIVEGPQVKSGGGVAYAMN